jgi:predicted  nucleic acid-binding Zn-ribbon protein
MFRAIYCTTILYVALASVAGFAQTEPATEPSLTFVRGEARPMEQRWGGFMGVGQPKVTATFETRPALGPGGEATLTYSQVENRALAEVFGEQTGFGPGGLGRDSSATYFRGKAGIERMTIFEDQRPVADLWTIIASSDDEAKALVTAFLRSYGDVVARGIENSRQELPDIAAKIEEKQPAIAECETQIQRAEEECRQVGVADMTDEAIDSAIARFAQEQRLNQVDIAGLEASLASAKQRAGGGGELAQTLARIQVELDIQLVGKLARKDALLREVRELQAGRAARAHIHELQKKLADVKKSVSIPESNLSYHEKWIQNLEGLRAHFGVTDNRVTISPVAQTR